MVQTYAEALTGTEHHMNAEAAQRAHFNRLASIYEVHYDDPTTDGA
jgi:hypothetical protein